MKNSESWRKEMCLLVITGEKLIIARCASGAKVFEIFRVADENHGIVIKLRGVRGRGCRSPRSSATTTCCCASFFEVGGVVLSLDRRGIY
jgi:hypothetical protein